MIGNLHFGSAVTAAFLASLVEAVEALTIVLAVAVVRGWRPAGLGALAGLVTLALVVVALGPLLDRIPLEVLQLVVGVLLLLFGMRWLRKAILRAGGMISLRDETAAFSSETIELRDAERQHEPYLDWIAGLASFKAVLLEGLEVVFIVIAVTAGRGALVPVSVAALTACLIVAAVGLFVHRPLTRVPANVLKFAVGVMLSAFGLFWTGEGLGVAWPGSDLSILAFIALFLATGLIAATALRKLWRGHLVMKMFIGIVQALAGLFIDDGALAFAVIIVVAVAGICVALLPSAPWASGAILLFGSLGALLVNVMRAHPR